MECQDMNLNIPIEQGLFPLQNITIQNSPYFNNNGMMSSYTSTPYGSPNFGGQMYSFPPSPPREAESEENSEEQNGIPIPTLINRVPLFNGSANGMGISYPSPPKRGLISFPGMSPPMIHYGPLMQQVPMMMPSPPISMMQCYPPPFQGQQVFHPPMPAYLESNAMMNYGGNFQPMSIPQNNGYGGVRNNYNPYPYVPPGQGGRNNVPLSDNNKWKKRNEKNNASRSGGDLSKNNAARISYASGSGSSESGGGPSENKSGSNAQRSNNKRSKSHWKKRCSFCSTNKDASNVTHSLRDRAGVLVCPVLRKHKCERCGATEDNAHTDSYCPENPEGREKREAAKRLRNSYNEEPRRNARGLPRITYNYDRF